MPKSRNWEADHQNNVDAFAQKVRLLYFNAIREAVRLGLSVSYNPNKPFTFSRYPQLNDRVKTLFESLASKMLATVSAGSQHEWMLSAAKNDELVKSIINTSKLPKASLDRYLDRNLEGLKAFQLRKSEGMNLSDRIWKLTGQFKQEMEFGLDVGLAEGKSAAELATDFKVYLEDPDKLFRRVRDLRGVLHLSKAAQAYNPGQGVYRSSFKNAMRVTRSEINMAYRTADHERWQNLDFVVGFEVRRSNNPYPCVVCESLKGKYPKTFRFRQWHPQCRCNCISILATQQEIDHLTDLILNDGDTSAFKSVNEVTTMPEGFVSWIKSNKPRLLRAKSQPYFIQDNFKGGSIAGGLNIPVRKSGLTKTDIRRSNPFELTDEMIKSLKESRGLSFNGSASSFNKILRGFDIPTFDAELTQIALEKGFSWSTKSYEFSDGRISFEYSGIFKNSEVMLMRSFYFADGIKTVDHDLFVVPKSLQGSGLSKQIFRRLYRQYQNAGVQRINVHANIDVGGYAWAKYGFSMTRKRDVEALKVLAKAKLSVKQYKDFMEIYEMYKDKFPFPVRHIANRPYGKDLLLESDWYGTIDLEDDAETEYFERYLFGK